MTRAPCAAAVVCALALAISAADAKPRHPSAAAASPALVYCPGDQTYRQACAATEDRMTHQTSGNAKVSVGNSRRSPYGSATTDRSCLTADTRAILEQAEAHFGVTFKLVSTCRPGAVIAGTNHPSEHRYGKAVDLLPRAGMKSALVRWFYAHAPGVTMIYAHMAHVHFDTGPFHALACGGCGRPNRVHLAHAR